MKVDIDEDGILTISAYIPIEKYALKKWEKENVINYGERNIIKYEVSNLIIRTDEDIEK